MKGLLPLTKLFSVNEIESVGVVGSGGKTSLLWLLAQKNKDKPVLVSSTTKFFMSQTGGYDVFCEYKPKQNVHEENQEAVQKAELEAMLEQAEKIQSGVILAAEVLSSKDVFAETLSGAKLGALPPFLLNQLRLCFSKVFLECDGSRRKGYKGWASYEPVVPPWVTKTVGVIPIPTDNFTITENTVHRPDVFCQLAHAEMGEPLLPKHIAAVITHKKGLMAHSVGERILFISGCDKEREPSTAGYAKAEEIVSFLPSDFLQSLVLVIAGSARYDEGRVLWHC